MTARTILMWRRHRARTWKQVGTATAPNSVLTIRDYMRLAATHHGHLIILTAASAQEARAQISLYQSKDYTPATTLVLEGGRVIALGLEAMRAVANTNHACRMWGAWIAKQGKVTVKQATALLPDENHINPSNVFGRDILEDSK